MDFMTILQLLDSTVRLATPLLLACLAGLFSERAGIFDIGLEGKMLAAAFMSAAVAFASGSVWIGLLAGIGASVALSALHGLASITFRGNQLISGVAINFLAAGLTVVVSQTWFNQGGRTPSLQGEARFQNIDWPGAAAMEERFDAARAGDPSAADISAVYWELASGHSILVYVALLIVPLTWWVLFRTRFGLRLRAVGENPAAVDTAGISVVGLRYAAVLICGVLCGLAGAYLATGLSAGFVKEMSAGRGFIALAALIFAKWRPWYALYACLLFGLLDAIGNRYQNVDVATPLMIAMLLAAAAGLFYAARKATLDLAVLGGLALLPMLLAATLVADGSAPNVLILNATWIILATAVIALAAGLILRNGQIVIYAGLGGIAFISYATLHSWAAGALAQAVIPVQFMQALPYILTVVILAGFIGKAIPPKAGGEPYVKER